MTDQGNPWDANEGKYDQPSSGVPKVSSTKQGAIPADFFDSPGTCDHSAAYRGIEAIAEDLVDALGLDAASELVAVVATEVEAPTEPSPTGAAGSFAHAHLRQIVERAERIIEDRRAIQQDLAELMGFAKGLGFDTKTIRAVIKLRELDRDQRAEADAVLAIYRDALGVGDEGRPAALPEVAPIGTEPRKVTSREKQKRSVLALNAAARFSTRH